MPNPGIRFAKAKKYTRVPQLGVLIALGGGKGGFLEVLDMGLRRNLL